MDILITPDNNVIAPTCVMLHSISHSNPNSSINIHLMHYELTDNNIEIFKGECKKLKFKLHLYKYDGHNIEKLYKAMPQGDLTHSALLRCFLAEALPNKLNKILYLDIDLIVIAPLAELYSTNLDGKIAGVIGESKEHPYEECNKIGKIPFNSGVMLIDLKKWRSHLVTQEVTDYMTKYPEKCRFHDQSALNVVIEGKVKYLPTKWNVIHYMLDYQDHREMAIIHFAATKKPWVDPTINPYGIFYCNYSKYTLWPTAYEKPKFSLKRINWKRKRRILVGSIRKRIPFI